MGAQVKVSLRRSAHPAPRQGLALPPRQRLLDRVRRLLQPLARGAARRAASGTCGSRNVDNRAILAKFQATFDQYWDENDFEPYDRERFLEAIEATRRAARRPGPRVQLRPYPHQQEVLDALEPSARHGHTRNLVVAATGTGKTVVAAFDYARLRRAGARRACSSSPTATRSSSRAGPPSAPRCATATSASCSSAATSRLAATHVFASIQSLHAEAPRGSRARRLRRRRGRRVPPRRGPDLRARCSSTFGRSVLLGLTATPERADGKSVLHWFDDRVAAELRLWDALDQGLLVPVPVLRRLRRHRPVDASIGEAAATTSTRSSSSTRRRRARQGGATAPCARTSSPPQRRCGRSASASRSSTPEFMAEYFRAAGLAAAAVHGRDTQVRAPATRCARSSAASFRCIFTVDLFNEGVDLPAVDTVLFLRPTESATVFLQQLGRGLRLADDKECLTVLDFIGQRAPRVPLRSALPGPGRRQPVVHCAARSRTGSRVCRRAARSSSTRRARRWCSRT